MAVGWIKLHRKILESSLWQSKEPFSVRDAWIDLLLLANHSDKKILFDGEPYTVKRGQHVTSIRKLSERWGWSTKKTRRYLGALEEDKMVTKKSTNKHTCVTILNYAKYQGLEDIEGKQNDTQSNTQKTHGGNNSCPPNKNIKNIKNEKNIRPSGSGSESLDDYIKLLEGNQ